MKKIFLCMLFLMIAGPSFADLLLPPEEAAQNAARWEQAKQAYEKKRLKCPKDKPLFFNETCYSCDDPQEFELSGSHQNILEKCEEVCPHREIYTSWRSGPFWAKSCRISPQYIRDKNQQERNKRAEICKCPKSHPLYGRKKASNGQVIELCHSCRTPAILPAVKGDDVCSQERFWSKKGNLEKFSELQTDITPDTTTIECRASARSTKPISHRSKRNR